MLHNRFQQIEASGRVFLCSSIDVVTSFCIVGLVSRAAVKLLQKHMSAVSENAGHENSGTEIIFLSSSIFG